MKILYNNKKGQTLIEVIVAMGIISVSLMGIMNMVMSSKKLIFEANDNATANSLAQEGIDTARHQREIGCSFRDVKLVVEADMTPQGAKFAIEGDTFPDGNALNNSMKLITYPVAGSANQISGIGTKFTREIWIAKLGNLAGSTPDPTVSFPSNVANTFDTSANYYYMTVKMTWTNLFGDNKNYTVSTIIIK